MGKHYYQGVFSKVFQREEELSVFHDLGTFAGEDKPKASDHGSGKEYKWVAENAVMEIDRRVYTA